VNVVRLDEYRRTRQQTRLRARRLARQPAAAQDAEHYFCMRCDGDQFRLYAGGEVHCGQCGSLMQNLAVGETIR
jgi:Zn finger protein HypA/HybF involved in hydrogenase expression